MKDHSDDIAAIAAIDAVPLILDIVCRTTGMGFAAIARVTDDRWIACQVRDRIDFGLGVGGELPVATTICSAIRDVREAVVIDEVSADGVYATHPTPKLYGFQSYISVPITLKNGTFFGTLCAIDPKPAKVDTPEIRGMFALFAELIATHLQNHQRVEDGVARQREIEERLRQSQKMEAVGQLTGGLAHDFNNLLTGIAGSLELMKLRLSQGRSGELDRYIAAAQGASKRASALTQRLLAFSRRQTLSPEITDVAALVSGMADLITQSIGARIHFAIEGTTAGWKIRIDANQLENALLNLCINARDAMPDGGRLVVTIGQAVFDTQAAADHEVPPGRYVVLAVVDTGAGMPAEVVARAFDPFFTTKPIGMGTGLGLSMVYGFVRQSGGQVRIDSRVGSGTTVTLCFPAHEGRVASSIEAAASRGIPVGTTSRTVLVVDDEPTVRMLLVDLLNEMGYAAIEAPEAARAMEVLDAAATIDLLVTDIGLPGGIDGLQLAKAARLDRPGLKVLFITGYADEAVIDHDDLDGDMQIVTKPFEVEALGERIRRFVEH